MKDITKTYGFQRMLLDATRYRLLRRTVESYDRGPSGPLFMPCGGRRLVGSFQEALELSNEADSDCAGLVLATWTRHLI